jgi:hypothetical protein
LEFRGVSKHESDTQLAQLEHNRIDLLPCRAYQSGYGVKGVWAEAADAVPIGVSRR